MSTVPKRSLPLAGSMLALFNAGTAVGLTDRELLQRFGAGDVDAAELAFTVLVERHGEMVLRVCRSVAGNVDDAEDAFQATFMILAKKARTVRVADSVAPWLHGVARKVSSRALASSRRRLRLLETLGERSKHGSNDRPALDDSYESIRGELERLPARYQSPVRLCDLEGFSQDEAAAMLGLPLGTVKSRLFRGRSKLRERLLRRGISPAMGSVPQALIHIATPPRLATLTVRAALLELQGGAGGVVTGAVVALTEGSVRAMFMTKIKLAVLVAVGSGVVAGGALVRNEPGAAFGGFFQEKGEAPAVPPVADLPPVAKPHPDSNVQEEIDLVKPLVKAKQEAVDRFKAQVALANAVVSANTRLNERVPNSVGAEEIAKAQAEANDAKVGLTRAELTLHAAEAHLEQLQSLQEHSEAILDAAERKDPYNPFIRSERRFLEIEAKLDRLLASQRSVRPPLATDPFDLAFPTPPRGPFDQDIVHEIAVQETRVAVKKGAVARTEAKHRLAKSSYEYAMKLKEKGVVSDGEVLKQETEITIAQADLDVANAELHQAQLDFDRLKSFQAQPDRKVEGSKKPSLDLDAEKIEKRFADIERKLDQILEGRQVPPLIPEAKP